MNDLKKFSKSRGQAALEYILIFSSMSFLAVSMSKAISSYFDLSVSSLGHALTQKLSSGVCKSSCFYRTYGNGQ